MLDPAFEDDPPSPGIREMNRTRSSLQRATNEEKNKQMLKNRMQLTKYTQGGIALPIKRAELPISDYHNNTTWARQGSMLESIGRRTKAMGIKEYAWEGMQSESDDQRLTHHYDKKFLENNHKFQ